MHKNYYAIIPASVRYDKNIRPNAKLLYGEITALCNEKGYCWASNNYFADLYNVSKTSISLWIKELLENNYIASEIIYKEGTKEVLNRHIRIIDPYLSKFNDPIQDKLNTPVTKIKHPTQEKLEGSLSKVNEPIQEKLKGNSTSNTTNNNTVNKEEEEDKKGDSHNLDSEIDEMLKQIDQEASAGSSSETVNSKYAHSEVEFVKMLLLDSNIPESDTGKICNEIDNRFKELFVIECIVAQLDWIVGEVKSGKSFFDIRKYFITGLERRASISNVDTSREFADRLTEAYSSTKDIEKPVPMHNWLSEYM